MSLKVAIFEDNMLLREMMFQLINGTNGYICTGSFHDANNVIQKIQKSMPDVVLMDIEMPGMNGIEATKKIKEHYPSILVVMQTAYEEDDKIFDAISVGASGYLVKNVAPVRLLEAIAEVNAGGSPMSPSVARKVLEMFSLFKQQSNKEEFDFSDREKEVLDLLVKGMSYKMIADACFLSIDTVKFHIKKIYDKMHVNSKAEAIAKAFLNGIVQVSGDVKSKTELAAGT
jgi:DNA-binding NarL/FixJ family response regulator